MPLWGGVDDHVRNSCHTIRRDIINGFGIDGVREKRKSMSDSDVETVSEIRIGAKRLKSSSRWLAADAGRLTPAPGGTDPAVLAHENEANNLHSVVVYFVELDSTMNSQPPKSEPDPDAIKMFVGQIPRSMDEDDLRKMFEEFGMVFQLNVLRDKVTGQSKGCCFVTFYTRKAALEAQNALHNIKTMAGMQHPIQMKPADSEKRNIEERKLFVGMLSKKCNENDVRMMFSPFGQIEECTVLREQNGQSKGCAFVTYTSKQCAQNAIKSMHHSQTMEGCRSPLVVKFADTQKEKEMKKLQQMQSNLLNAAGVAGLGVLGPQYLSLLQQAVGAGNLGALGNVGNLGLGGLNALQLQQLLAAAGQAVTALQNNPGLPALLAGLNAGPLSSLLSGAQSPTNNNTVNLPMGNSSTSPVSSTNSSSLSPNNCKGDINNLQNLQNLQGLAALAALANNPAMSAMNPQNLAALQQLAAATSSSSSVGGTIPGINSTGTSTPTSSAGSMGATNTTNSTGIGTLGMQNNLGPNIGNPSAMGAPNNSLNGLGNTSVGQAGQGIDALSQAYSGIQQYAASFPNAFTAQNTTQLQQATSTSPAGKQTEGPDGANLFIYHLPQEFGDQDLMQMFMPFGTVVSAKVFIDKQTNLSKCFGFVSYDNPLSAQAAIQAMNGFQIGMKRLKVQLKRPKSENKPY
ncbi:hypothetical protein LSH36_355g04005 [Paralvinella palmiformis]|uniref:RRM domain-containing protein n=1 Tax=Paralvinella palmiformis TaxID=53620 RepID=A0AAD9JEU5_9ANNE|nr:hypothetical protein LSH36_355g04005 [Paralvinella palmiformis]